jgi:hypothetical protein
MQAKIQAQLSRNAGGYRGQRSKLIAIGRRIAVANADAGGGR